MYLIKPAAHCKANSVFSKRLFKYPGCHISRCKRCTADNACFAFYGFIFFRCKSFEQFQIRSFLPVVVKPCAGAVNADRGQMCFVFSHSFQRTVVGRYDRRHRGAHNGCELHISLTHSLCGLCDEHIITSEDSVHITEPCAEDSTFFEKPPWLIKAANISCTAPCIADNHKSPQLVKHPDGARLIRCKG